ncbi:hypothetical protein ABEO75_18855 [Paenibacillus macerans]|uniref:hypothetical protein n=1 Tax=Paenibacillus macerans TaxID=44252 RepID=UPI002E1A7CA9|nr:hypothetical protein [Paenibacillus macerans]
MVSAEIKKLVNQSNQLASQIRESIEANLGFLNKAITGTGTAEDNRDQAFSRPPSYLQD